MGVRLTSQEEKTALYDSVTDMAFGPVFDSLDAAETFLAWYTGKYGDPRDEWFLDRGGQLTFLDRWGVWSRATRDVNTGEFRLDIAIQMMRDVT